MLIVPALLAAVPVLPSRAAGTAGALDPTFGTRGTVVAKFYGFAAAVVLQPDGRVVVGGTTDVTSGRFGFALLRYNRDGTLDRSFGRGGKVTTGFSLGEGASVAALALQPDGKIVAAGRIDTGVAFALARYNRDGTLDRSFGRDGKVTTDVSFGGDNAIAALVVQPDGKIVAGGFATPETSGVARFALARYDRDGSLDTSFGTGGIVATDLGGGSSRVSAMILQPDGKIVAGGGWRGDFALARYQSDGRLDTSFGTRGVVTTNFGFGGDSISDLALRPDGKIVAGGSAAPPDGGGFSVFALARYEPDGHLDPGFGVGGKVTNDFVGRDSGIGGLALQPDGKIVAVGGVTRPNQRPSGLFALARYSPDGELDPDFGVAGEITTGFRGESGAHDVALQPNGKIVVVGETTSRRGGELPFWSYFVVARYRAR